MSCQTALPRLGELLVGALDDAETEAILEHVEGCVACGRELAELQLLEEGLQLAATAPSQSAPAAATPAPPSRRTAHWKLWLGPAIAAGVLATALLGRTSSTAPHLLRGDASTPTDRLSTTANVPLGVPLTIHERASLALPDGSVITASAGTQLELTGRRAVTLTTGRAAFRVAKHDTPFAVLTPRGTARVLGTTFRLEVKETVMKPAVKASVAATVVTLAVASGAVLFLPNTGDGLRVDAGQEIVAGPDGVDLLDSRSSAKVTPEQLEELDQRKLAIEEQTAEMNAKLTELEAKLAISEAEVAELEAKLAAEQQAEPAAKTKLAVDYGEWSKSDLLKSADWKEMGGAFKAMLEAMPELYDVLRRGEQPSTELAIKFSRENTKLLKFAIETMGKLPTNASSTGNGSFTHPIVTSNLLVEHMEQAGEPLSEAQMWTLHRLGADYDAGSETAQAGYTESTHTLQKIIDELTLKLTFYDGMTAMLTAPQRALVVNPEFQHVAGIDIYSPVLMLTGVAQPDSAPNMEVLRSDMLNKALGWGFESAALQGQGIVFDTWIAALGELTPVPAAQAQFVDVQHALRSAKAQLAAMQELEVRLAPSAELKKSLRELGTFTVPVLRIQ